MLQEDSASLRSRIVVIDDEPEIGELIAAVAGGLDLDCTITTKAEQFFEALGDDVIMVLIDLLLPEVDGVEILRQLSARDYKAKVVLLSGIDKKVLRSAEVLAQSLGLLAVGKLQKPFRISDIEEVLGRSKDDREDVRLAGQMAAPVTEAELRRAIDLDEFIVHYQPQVNLKTGKIAGVEALVRLLHPIRGVVYPDMFIVTAEQLGLIDVLTTLVMKRALAEYAGFATGSIPEFSLSINFSARSLNDLRLPDQIERLSNELKVPLSSLVMEITETGIIAELGKALDILTRLRMKKVGLSIDDFGTGYSSMAQLRRIPATELKIDRLFIKDMLVDEGARAVVDQTIELGHRLDMWVVAEGVETKEQHDALTKLGCDLAQGYHYSKPLEAEALISWIGERERAEKLRE